MTRTAETDHHDLTIDLAGHPFHVRVGGSGVPVVLLHGFPDSSALWRHQFHHLAASGFRVIAPDLRGFGESWKPQDVSSYAATKLLADVVGIMHNLEIRRAHIVGHDFGAMVAWMLGSLMPRRVDHLVCMSVAHPNVFRELTLEQRRRWWYSLLFLLPEAEQIIRQRNWRLLHEMLDGQVDSDRWMRDLKRPGALTAALNWYRANTSPANEVNGQRRTLPPVAAPTLALWGTGDVDLTEEAMRDSGKYVEGPWRYERVEGAGHWIPLDAPDTVSKLITDWLGSQPTSHEVRRLSAQASGIKAYLRS
jgi:pimeloyl-ACP methyl ester carboxylesterase